MLNHHLQRSIVYALAFQANLRFSDLKPDDIENKLFTYHLKKTIISGFVTKDSDGLYSLTPEGRRYSTGAQDKDQALIIERAHSVLLLAIRRKVDSAWLLYTRNTHPMRGYSGLPHANPNSEQTIAQAAQQQCLERTGLLGDFRPLGSGFIRIIKDGALESYTNFTLLVCDDVAGELVESDVKASYYWQVDPDFSSTNMFPVSRKLFQAYTAGKPFFFESTHYI